MSKFQVCLTGGIASGKTYVSDSLASLGVHIIDTDVLARTVVEPGTSGLSQLVAEFGDEILLDDGHLNRAGLKQIIFSDRLKLNTVNNILHPLIWQEGKQLSESNKATLEIWVIPLFVGNQEQVAFDRVLVVDVADSIQLQRIVDRDQINDNMARRIVKSQPSRLDRLRLATDVIVNNSSLRKLDQNILRIYKMFQVMAQL